MRTMLLRGLAIVTALCVVRETTAISSGPGPEVGLGFRAAAQGIKASAWKTYGKLIHADSVQHAGETKKTADSAKMSDDLTSLGAEVKHREHDIIEDRKLQNKLQSLQQHIFHEAGTLHDDANDVRHGAKEAEKRAVRLLQPGVLSKEADEEVAYQAALNGPSNSNVEIKSTLDVQPENGSKVAKVEQLAAVAERAAEEQQQYIKQSGKEAQELGKVVAETNTKLKAAAEKQIEKRKEDMEAQKEEMHKMGAMLKKGRTAVKQANAQLKRASTSAARGKLRAQQMHEANALKQALLPTKTEASAAKAEEKAQADMQKATQEVQQAEHDEDDSDKKDDDTENEEDEEEQEQEKKPRISEHVAKMDLLKAQAKVIKAKKVKAIASKEEDGADRKEEALFAVKVKKMKQVKTNSEENVANAKNVVEKEEEAFNEQKKRIADEETKILELQSLVKQIPGANASDSVQPLSNETNALVEAEAVIESARKAAKAVKIKAREQIKEALQKATVKNLLLGKEVQKEKHQIAQEETVVKAQDAEIQSESVSEKETLAKAKLDAKGAQEMMKEAKREQHQVVDSERKAAGNVISSMKQEIQKQLAEARKKDKDREEGAKLIYAKASGMLLQAKSLVGDYTSQTQSKKTMKKVEDPKRLAKMSFDKLKSIATEQMDDMAAQFDSIKVHDRNDSGGKDADTDGTKKPDASGDTTADKPDVSADAPSNKTDVSADVPSNNTAASAKGAAAQKAENVEVAKAEEAEMSEVKSCTSHECIAAKKAVDKVNTLKKELKEEAKKGRDARLIDDELKRVTAQNVAVARTKDLKQQLRIAEQDSSDLSLKNDTAALKTNSTYLESIEMGLSNSDETLQLDNSRSWSSTNKDDLKDNWRIL